MPSRRHLLRLGAAALAAPAITQAAERVVNVYNWSDYIDPEQLKAFTRETGIRVVYDTYDTNEVLETKLLAGKSGYDLVVPSGPFLQRLIAAGAFRKLDKALLPNLRHLWPEITARLAIYDPGNLHAVDYMWGTTGLGFNVAKVKERLGGDMPADWSALLDPEKVARLRDCGVQVLDAPEDVLPSVMKGLGLDPASRAEADLRRAGDALASIRPSIQKFNSSEYIAGLANGDVCFALGYSGDVIQARKRAAEARSGVEVAYVIPREGALMWFDALAIPADADHAAEAHALIDYLLRPEVAAANTNFVSYASGNLAAQAFVRPDILADPGIYPDAATMARLFTNSAFDDRTQRIVTRLWTRVRTGR